MTLPFPRRWSMAASLATAMADTSPMNEVRRGKVNDNRSMGLSWPLACKFLMTNVELHGS